MICGKRLDLYGAFWVSWWSCLKQWWAFNCANRNTANFRLTTVIRPTTWRSYHYHRLLWLHCAPRVQPVWHVRLSERGNKRQLKLSFSSILLTVPVIAARVLQRTLNFCRCKAMFQVGQFRFFVSVGLISANWTQIYKLVRFSWTNWM